MKKQTGIWLNSDVWEAYRVLCRREKLRPAEPIEGFVEFVLRSGSALTVLNMMRGWDKAEGLEAYARVLLNWYTHGKFFFSVTDEDEAPVEPLLLQALKDVEDPRLRREIEEALLVRPRKQAPAKREADEARETGDKESAGESESEEAEDSEEIKRKSMSVDELKEKIRELKRLRELVRSAKASRTS